MFDKRYRNLWRRRRGERWLGDGPGEYAKKLA
ncbi:hypothetical protein KCP77_21000 [Salmonella enterica subsp. enterica]|nr:hypothetical protein KCP77_21000 [Salmonella enterica subsp. enterica]